MTMTMHDTANVEGVEPISASVLYPWLVFGEQVTSQVELHALSKAIDAVTMEWSASWSYGQAMWQLESGLAQLVGPAFALLQAAGRNLRQASADWGAASDWLATFGDPERKALYQTLLQHALAQQQRLAQQVEQLRVRVVWLCQQWGVALDMVPDLSREAIDGH